MCFVFMTTLLRSIHIFVLSITFVFEHALQLELLMGWGEILSFFLWLIAHLGFLLVLCWSVPANGGTGRISVSEPMMMFMVHCYV